MLKEHAIRKNGETRRGGIHTLLGILISGVGFFWLAKKVGWIAISAGGSGVFWPVLVMVLGLAIVLRSGWLRGRNAK